MKNRIDQYFDAVVKDGFFIINTVKYAAPTPTITGLSLFLGFSSVSSFKNYQTDPEFADTVAYGFLRIENHYEHLLQTEKMARAGEVGLKKMGDWKDSIDMNVSGSHNLYVTEAIKRWKLTHDNQIKEDAEDDAVTDVNHTASND
jgi:hypothetical protein